MSNREIQGLFWLVPLVAILWSPFLFAFQKIYVYLFEKPKCSHGIAGGITEKECEICCKPCIHGISGGVTRGLCSKCMEICPHGFVGGISREICPTCALVPQENGTARSAETKAVENQEYSFAYNFDNMYQEDVNSNTDVCLDWGTIDKMTGYEFEDYICKIYESLGYEVEHTPYSGDGGKDAILRKDGEVYLIECKHYVSGSQVGERDLRIFDSAMHDYNAKKGFYINLGRFKRGTEKFAREHNIELIGRTELKKMLEAADQMYDSDEVRGV